MFGNGRACAGPRGNTARRKICYCYLMYLSTTWMDGWVLESMRKKTLRQKKKQWVKSSSWPLPEVISNGCFVEALALVEELSNIIAGILQQVILNQELDPLRKRQGPGLHPRWTNHISDLNDLNSYFHLPFWGPCWISFGPWPPVYSSAYFSWNIRAWAVVSCQKMVLKNATHHFPN